MGDLLIQGVFFYEGGLVPNLLNSVSYLVVYKYPLQMLI
jgi:hypothetical protein